MRPVADWSLGARLVAVVLSVAVAAGFVFWLFNLDSGSQDAAGRTADPATGTERRPASDTPRSIPPATSTTSRSTAPSSSPDSGTAPSPSPSPAGSVASAPPLAFSDQDIDAAGQVASAWVAGIASIDWQQDQQARTDVLRAYVADQSDTALTQWLAPSDTTLTDLTRTRTVLTGTAEVTQVVTVARASILLQVRLTQTTSRDGVADPAPSTADYIVTLVPRDGQWLVTAMIGAADGDPGT